jgi:hypothetical protein
VRGRECLAEAVPGDDVSIPFPGSRWSLPCYFWPILERRCAMGTFLREDLISVLRRRWPFWLSSVGRWSSERVTHSSSERGRLILHWFFPFLSLLLFPFDAGSLSSFRDFRLFFFFFLLNDLRHTYPLSFFLLLCDVDRSGFWVCPGLSSCYRYARPFEWNSPKPLKERRSPPPLVSRRVFRVPFFGPFADRLTRTLMPPIDTAGGAKSKKTAQNPLFEKKSRSFGIGGDLPPKADLTRFVKWPEYVRLQRQKVILNQRLKVSSTGRRQDRSAYRTYNIARFFRSPLRSPSSATPWTRTPPPSSSSS